jgi:hypothetical protein
MSTLNTPINTIYRFKLSEYFLESMLPFVMVHQYSDRKIYKEKWNEWVENNYEVINRESNRLIEHGYTGNIMDKMYKSGRYYFRSKKQQEPKKRRQYISIDHEIIELMDDYINQHINIKPSLSYISFCDKYVIQIESEINGLLKEDVCKDIIKDKIKKTYKNRHFLLTKT